MEQRDETSFLSDFTDLGPCCICAGGGAVNVLTLPQRSATPGRGWGCVRCGLPSDGAVAVVCDVCLGRYRRNNAELSMCCTGYPGSDGRMPISDLAPGAFAHDPARHPELSDDLAG